MKKMEAVSLNQVDIQDAFWSGRQKLIREVVIPYQWDALNDRIPGAEPSRTIENFRIAAGEAEGEYYGMVFQDSDLAKWLETAGFALALQRDERLEAIADEVIDLLSRAQQPDGYLNTYFTVKKPGERWTNLRDDHELYCAGHLIEAAVAYYEATGKRKVLDIVCRLADHISSVFGLEPGQKRGYDGHPEIELALVKLYRATGNRKYLELSRFFVEERGRQPHYFELEEAARTGSRVAPRSFDYFQAHLPVREQKTAEGHSVRAVYLFSGMADLAMEYNDAELLEVCKTLWNNVTRKRMYVTGGIGSSSYGERFTVDYDLPNDRAYTETCAAIGLMFWAHRMLQMEADREYADVMERALYNGLLSGISLDGKRYFYVNPLEVWPDTTDHRHDMRSVKKTRQPWFGCACCPPNIARLLASLGQYIYSCNDSELYVHLYIAGAAQPSVGGRNVGIRQQTNYPWNETVALTVSVKEPAPFTLALRLPSWCRDPRLFVNGEPVRVADISEKGYAKINREWNDGDRVELVLPMPVEKVRSHPNVRENAGMVALMRGPIVYCLEEADNGSNLRDITIAADAGINARFEEHLLGGVVVLESEGWRTDPSTVGDSLYTTNPYGRVPAPIKAVPYFAWANREPGEMLVWIRERCNSDSTQG